VNALGMADDLAEFLDVIDELVNLVKSVAWSWKNKL